MKVFTILIPFFICLNINAQNEPVSKWHVSRGAEINFPSEDYTYFKKGKLFCFISNDNTNIYIEMKIEDKEAQSRILSQGLTIWINMDGKSGKKMGVRYPLGSQHSMNQNKSKIPDSILSGDESPSRTLLLANTIELVGFANAEASRFPAENADTFSGSVKFGVEGCLLYELVMPIEKLPLRNSKDGKGAMPFTLGIEYGEAPVLFWIKNIKLATDK